MTNELEQDRRDYFLDKAEEDWEACWPPEPRRCVTQLAQRVLDRDWLVEVVQNIVYQYDGPLSDFAEHLEDFRCQWVTMRAARLEEEAEEDARQAQMDAAADRDLFDREEW